MIKIGHVTLKHCHRMPSRSFFYKGKQFPVCARCTGIHIGYLLYPLFLFDLMYLNLLVSICLILPTYIDGSIQMIFDIESKNYRRLITGLMAGVGTVSLLCIIGTYIGNLIIQLT
ncbi:MAG: DUF2085 domain-containing protein [bacterium]|nr:DUF2085 domain-containing protein [bacterium]